MDPNFYIFTFCVDGGGVCDSPQNRRADLVFVPRYLPYLVPMEMILSLFSAYFLLSHRQPPATAKIADDSFGDWRPHMAVILSNLLEEPKVRQLMALILINNQ